MSFELLEYFVTRSQAVGVSMEKFEDDDSSKVDDSFLCDGWFGLSCGVAGDKGICVPWICVFMDSRDLRVMLQVESVWKMMIHLYLDR